ncbi:MAG TPA: hypothetical protein VGP72_05235 [Planctomycetota bacterium]|jgi:hypothetical protein
MACYSIVAIKTQVKAPVSEVAQALIAMGYKNVMSDIRSVLADGLQLSCRGDDTWEVTRGTLDVARFTREVARAKVLAEARRQGYRVTVDSREGEQIKIRLRVQ